MDTEKINRFNQDKTKFILIIVVPVKILWE